MQSLHELERRAEVHRLEVLKKIDALSESSVEEQALGPEAPANEHESTEAAVAAAAASHQQR
jgi:hypothetical protein